jgi:3-dehydroquinate synthase
MNVFHNLTIKLDTRSYDIRIGSGLIASAGSACKKVGLSGRAAIISNTTVAPLYAAQLTESLQQSGFETHLIKIPDGEEYKTLATLGTVYNALLEAGIDRHDFIIALGGGVVGDLAGFAAATWLRGIPFVQIPTTLLAQVDSSVGGKTGVDHSSGKNLIGAFYQPALVLADLDTLQTLSKRHYCAGLAEVVKYGMVLDANLFAKLEANTGQLLARDIKLLAEVVAICCNLKAKVVEQDERESGIRAILNYGHTLGHAFETLGNYRDFVHGEAVAIGMMFAAEISRKHGFADAADRDRLIALLQALQLPLTPPEVESDKLILALSGDKKNRSGSIGYICNRSVGGYEILKQTPIELGMAYRDALPVISENAAMELVELSLDDIVMEVVPLPLPITAWQNDNNADEKLMSSTTVADQPDTLIVDDPMLTPTIAELYHKQGFTDRAMEIYRQLHELNPEDGQIKARYLELGELAEATFAQNDVPDKTDEGKLSPENQAKVTVLESWLANIQSLKQAV